jgi:hypothetical protein
MRTKFIYAILFVFLGYVANAQRLGIKGGINFANVTAKMSGASMSPKSLTGFHVGGVADFDLKNNLAFNTGLLYTVKGFSGEDTESGKLKESLNYLEVPLNLAYKIPIKDQSKFFIQAGPYLAFGLNAKETVGSESQSGSFKDAGVKSLDYGLGLGAGVELGSFVAGIQYQLGLADINDESGVPMTLKNKVFQISLAYMFSGKK